MNIAVLGATGRSGRYFVDAALSAGHSVRAGVRGEHSLPSHPALSVIGCDISSPADMRRLLTGQHAVVSLIGHAKKSPADLQTTAIRTTIEGMNALGIQRIISLTGTGARQPGDHITLIDRILNLSIGIIDPARVRDGVHHVAALQQSELEWTIIRVLKLQNTKLRPYSLMPHGPTKVIVSRAEVAQAILQVLEQHSFVRQAPIIGHAKL